MRLSDVMSSLHLSVYPEIALVIFLIVFAGVCLSLLGKKDRFARSAAMPLDDDTEAVSQSPGGQQS